MEGKYEKLYCIKHKNFTLQGQFESKVFKYLRFEVKKCSSNCKEDSEIDNFIKGMGITLMFADSKIKDDPENIFNIFPKIYHYDL